MVYERVSIVQFPKLNFAHMFHHHNHISKINTKTPQKEMFREHSVSYQKSSKMTKNMKPNFLIPNQSECLMRQRKLSSDLFTVNFHKLEISDRELVTPNSRENPEEESRTKMQERCDSPPQTPPNLFNNGAPLFPTTNFSNNQGMGIAIYLEHDMAYSKLKRD